MNFGALNNLSNLNSLGGGDLAPFSLRNPILIPTGTVDGNNTTFVFSSPPSILFIDSGRIIQKISSDGTVNWTGTTTITLTIAPNFDIFGLISNYKAITGTVNGSNKSFTSTVTPQALVVDYGNVIKPTSADGTINWTGTTSQSLTIAPENDIFGMGSLFTPTGGIDGSNTTFIFSSIPKILIVDYGRAMRKVSSDGTVNWSGETTVLLTIAPNFDIIGL